MEELRNVLLPASTFLVILMIVFSKYLLPFLKSSNGNSNCKYVVDEDAKKHLVENNLLLRQLAESSERQERILTIIATRLNGKTTEMIEKLD